jgi:hypothetical protein
MKAFNIAVQRLGIGKLEMRGGKDGKLIAR